MPNDPSPLLDEGIFFPDGTYDADLYHCHTVTFMFFGAQSISEPTPYETVKGFTKKGDTLSLGSQSISIKNNPILKFPWPAIPRAFLPNGDLVVFHMDTPANEITAQIAAWTAAQGNPKL